MGVNGTDLQYPSGQAAIRTAFSSLLLIPFARRILPALLFLLYQPFSVVNNILSEIVSIFFETFSVQVPPKTLVLTSFATNFTTFVEYCQHKIKYLLNNNFLSLHINISLSMQRFFITIKFLYNISNTNLNCI